MSSEAETSRHAASKVVPRDGKPGLADSVRCVAASTALGMTAWCIAILSGDWIVRQNRSAGGSHACCHSFSHTFG